MPIKFTWFLLILLALFIVPYALYRDIHFEKAYSVDLRNRVVGARLIHAGISPYFYKWQTGTSMRYYDPLNFNDKRPSCITSSPFLHRLFWPLATLQESTISIIWLVLEYVFLLSLTALAWRLAKTTTQKQVIILLSLIFLVTNAWKMHVVKGQSYICIPLLCMAFLFFLRQKEKIGYALAAGAVAACLVLIKVYSIIFFLPFLWLIRSYSRSWLLAFFIPCVVAVGWIAGSSRERSLWLSYQAQVKDWTAIFQGKGDSLQQRDQPDPHFTIMEGINLPAAEALRDQQGPTRFYSECGNFYIIYLNVFHRFAPVSWLEITALLMIATCMLIFYYRNRAPYKRQHVAPPPPDILQLTILGVCLYMIVDLCSPICRSQYYEVQWLAALLIAAATFTPARPWPHLVILAGLLLCCVHLPFIKMQNTIGEYMILAALLTLALFPSRRPIA